MMRVTTVAALALLATACSSTNDGQEPERACTMIGCQSGFTVELDSAPPDGRVQVVAETPSGQRRIEECLGAGCERVLFADFEPEEVTLEVIVGGESVETTVRPEYRTLQPNGPDCPPTCRQGTVRVEAPGG